MRKIRETKVLYQCKICKSEHSSRRAAFDCEGKPIEDKIFSIGDLVSNIEPCVCWSNTSRGYVFQGTVKKILGPQPSDFEYECKWLGGENSRLNSHVFQYEGYFRCPVCKDGKSARYFAPELKKVK